MLLVDIAEQWYQMNLTNNKVYLHRDNGDTNKEYAIAVDRFFKGYSNKNKEFKKITKDEEFSAIERLKDNRKELEYYLIKHHIFLAINLASKYQYCYSNYDDLISSAMYGLIIAAQKFDITKKRRFCTYAVFWIKNIILSQFNIKKNTYISTHSDINFSDYYTPSGVDNEEEYDFIHNKVYNSVEASYYDMLGDSVKTACDNIIQDETELTRKELVDNISQSIAASSLPDYEKKLYKILFVDGISAKNASLMMHMKYSDVIKSKKTIKNFILKRFSSSI